MLNWYQFKRLVTGAEKEIDTLSHAREVFNQPFPGISVVESVSEKYCF